MRTTKYIALAVLMSGMAIAVGERESLQSIIDKSMTPGYGVHDDWLAENIKTWPGLKTTQGVAALYDLRMNTENGEIRIACNRIQEKLLVPREEVARFLIERSKENDADMYMMTKYILYMIPYADLPEVMQYCASLLGDKRRQNRNLMPLEGADIPQARRVASGILVKGFIKLGLLQENDPAFKWDVLYDEDVDRNIAALRPYLIQQGVIAADAPYPPQPGRTRPGGGLATTAPTHAGKRPAPPDTGAPADDTPGAGPWSWFHWLGLLLIAAALLWLGFGKRRYSGHGE